MARLFCTPTRPVVPVAAGPAPATAAPLRRTSACGALLLALASATGTTCVGAAAKSEPAPAIQSGAIPTGPLQADVPAAPARIRPAGPTSPEAIAPLGSVGPAPLRAAEPADATNTAALDRLRATAQQRVRRGTAAEREAGRAAWTLGLVYLHGQGVAQDRVQAETWFKRALALGEPLAAAGLAWCAIDGCEGPPAPAAARPWIARLRRDQPGAALYLEWLVENRLAPVRLAQPQRLGQAPAPETLPFRELLVRAAQSGDANAQIELGFEQLNAGRMAEAAAQFRFAAPRSAIAATNAELMARRESTPVLSQGRQSAATWLENARRYHRGEGVPANFAEAIRLYQLAASEGDPFARRMLALIYSRPAPNGQIDIAWMRQLADVDLSKEIPQVNPPSSVTVLRREPTPLYQYLPAPWKSAG